MIQLIFYKFMIRFILICILICIPFIIQIKKSYWENIFLLSKLQILLHHISYKLKALKLCVFNNDLDRNLVYTVTLVFEYIFLNFVREWFIISLFSLIYKYKDIYFFSNCFISVIILSWVMKLFILYLFHNNPSIWYQYILIH